MKAKREINKNLIVIILAVFVSGILMLSAYLNLKNSQQLQEILEDSITSQLLSIALSAQTTIDDYDLSAYNSLEDIEADLDNYLELRERLRALVEETGVTYIYALRLIDGEYRFIVDTDYEVDEFFLPYEPAQVHFDAFNGLQSAGAMNMVDEYGSFNCGAVPIWKDGEIIGVVSVDIEDQYLQRSTRISRRNTAIMLAAIAFVLVLMVVFIAMLMKRMREAQAQLQTIAHYDAVTNLPNRQYLFEYLESIIARDPNSEFALVFIDLDNFKSVNDNAGHDAGDELLRDVAAFLEMHNNDMVKSFRPAAGMLNISARIGGDEFIQVINGVSTAEQADAIAASLLKSFDEHNFSRLVRQYSVGLSVGVALYPYHSNSIHVLIKYADVAMYNAKHGGKNQYRVYDDSMNTKELEE